MLGGCARFPANPGAASGKRLVFTLTFQNDLRLGLGDDQTAYSYLVLIDNDNDPTGATGPIPVIQKSPAGSWGNGYAAGHFTHVVALGPFKSFQGPGVIGLYKLNDPDVDQNQLIPRGQPVSVTDPHTGDKVIRFELDTHQLGIDLTQDQNPVFIQVNVVATNVIPDNPAGDYDRFWEAFGNNAEGNLNKYINIDVRQDGVYDLQKYGADFEPVGDVRNGDRTEPSLDLIDFQIEVRS